VIIGLGAPKGATEVDSGGVAPAIDTGYRIKQPARIEQLFVLHGHGRGHVIDSCDRKKGTRRASAMGGGLGRTTRPELGKTSGRRFIRCAPAGSMMERCSRRVVGGASEETKSALRRLSSLCDDPRVSRAAPQQRRACSSRLQSVDLCGDLCVTGFAHFVQCAGRRARLCENGHAR
jgi:hypothetical protein